MVAAPPVWPEFPTGSNKSSARTGWKRVRSFVQELNSDELQIMAAGSASSSLQGSSSIDLNHTLITAPQEVFAGGNPDSSAKTGSGSGQAAASNTPLKSPNPTLQSAISLDSVSEETTI